MSKPVYKNKDVISLVTLAQSNDIKALEELIKRVQKHIFAIFSHLVEKSEDVSDLTQEVLLKMAKSVSQLKNPRKFNSWLNQIITNQYYDFAKKNPEKFISTFFLAFQVLGFLFFKKKSDFVSVDREILLFFQICKKIKPVLVIPASLLFLHKSHGNGRFSELFEV